MKSNQFIPHGFFYPLLLTIVGFLAFSLSSCSTSKKYGQTTSHQKSNYKQVRVKQARWNTTTSTSTTYYIKKQKPRKKFNP